MPNSAITRFAANLQSALREAHISRQFLADYLQCSVDAVNSWCIGRARINPASLNPLCLLLATKGKLKSSRISELSRQGLESYGFAQPWPVDSDRKSSKVTLCLYGSLWRRIESRAVEIISAHLRRRNEQVLISQCGDVGAVLSTLNIMDATNTEMVIMCGVDMRHETHHLLLEEISRRNVPAVLIDTGCPRDSVYEHPNVFAVGWDNFRLAYQATSLLIEAGHTRIGTVSLLKYPERLNGYRQALKDHGLAYQPRLVLQQQPSPSDGAQAISDGILMRRIETFVSDQGISAIFAQSETLTLIVSLVLAKLGRKLGDDVSLSGLAWVGWLGEELHLPLTYISCPIEEVTYRALDMVMHPTAIGDLQPEDRYVDATRLARRVDSAGGSIGLIGEKG
ncbi:MAG: substrate-binding domain-containing protein [Chloroflexi bacterium]|nr:substrate-binding domain-containing protein [Chloroflexota bacterium]